MSRHKQMCCVPWKRAERTAWEAVNNNSHELLRIWETGVPYGKHSLSAWPRNCIDKWSDSFSSDPNKMQDVNCKLSFSFASNPVSFLVRRTCIQPSRNISAKLFWYFCGHCWGFVGRLIPLISNAVDVCPGCVWIFPHLNAYLLNN